MSPSSLKAPLVSVIIPTYNMGQFVGDTVRSVQQQTFTDIEIHVVDDGSTDDTRVTIEPFLADPRLKYHFQENQGKSVAKNLGIRSSKGTFIAFSDADDLWLPEKLEWQIPLFDHSPSVGVVYSRSRRIDANGNLLEPVLYPEYRGRVTDKLFFENFIPFGTAVIRRDMFELHGGFNEKYRMGMDWEMFLRLSVHCEFDFVPQVTYLYRIWEGQMSTNWAKRYENAFQIMDEFVSANPEAVPKDVVRNAMASSYANRARSRVNASSDYSGGIADALRAAKYGHSVSATARLLTRCLARYFGLRRGPLDKP